jgi:hypothetical protein
MKMEEAQIVDVCKVTTTKIEDLMKLCQLFKFVLEIWS